MTCRQPSTLPAWHAALHLGFAPSGERTVLRENRHFGPLRVQKALYPEGERVCQTVLLHPPAGIAGGDHLRLSAVVEGGGHAQITTPGAGKWYRSDGAEASQSIDFTVAEGAVLEWLPQETIVFDGALARTATRVRLAADSRFIGWDIVCLGRLASGERFERGRFDLSCRIERDGRPIWLERGGLSGNDPMLASPSGWAGGTVFGSLLCSFPESPQKAALLLEACRAVVPADGARYGVTRLPGVFVARYLGDNSEAARHWFTRLWEILRPAALGRAAVIPRIWNT